MKLVYHISYSFTLNLESKTILHAVMVFNLKTRVGKYISHTHLELLHQTMLFLFPFSAADRVSVSLPVWKLQRTISSRCLIFLLNPFSTGHLRDNHSSQTKAFIAHKHHSRWMKRSPNSDDSAFDWDFSFFERK